ncbi:MAG: hypothetical protein SGPRY_014879 [Prymnesium sp.]
MVRMGELLGGERMIIRTVAFGDPNENFRVLKETSKQLPRGSFSKLGVNPAALRTALSAFSSSLTTLTTEAGTSQNRTLRAVRVHWGQTHDQEDKLSESKGWWITCVMLLILCVAHTRRR